MVAPVTPPSYPTTRVGLHAVAEQVLARARYEAVGRIGLRAEPGGFGTGPYEIGGDRRTAAVDGTDLVVADGTGERRSPLTTLASAADLLGVPAGAPPGVYPQATSVAPDEDLGLDPGSCAVVAWWFTLADRALGAFVAGLGAGQDVEGAVLWPEHFDLALVAGVGPARANYGASPGDDGVPDPYLYVGPWEDVPEDPFWDAEHFRGAVLRYADVVGAADPLAAATDFFRRGHGLLAAAVRAPT